MDTGLLIQSGIGSLAHNCPIPENIRKHHTLNLNPMYTVIDTNLAANALNFTSDWIGFSIIFFAINYKRNEDCMIKLFTKDWFFLVILIITAAFLLT
jgi:hypothetical protein